jgi:hypothetical protein
MLHIQFMDKFVVRHIFQVMYEELHAVPVLGFFRLCKMIWSVNEK